MKYKIYKKVRNISNKAKKDIALNDLMCYHRTHCLRFDNQEEKIIFTRRRNYESNEAYHIDDT